MTPRATDYAVPSLPSVKETAAVLLRLEISLITMLIGVRPGATMATSPQGPSCTISLPFAAQL